LKFQLTKLVENWSRVDRHDCAQILTYLYRDKHKQFGTLDNLSTYDAMLLVVHCMLNEQFRGRSCLDATLLWIVEQMLPLCQKMADGLEKHIEAAQAVESNVPPIDVSAIVIADDKYVTYTGCDAYYVFGGWKSIPELEKAPSRIVQLMPEIKFIAETAKFFGGYDREDYLRPLERIPNVIADSTAAG
jgi:hypothetical protein